MNNKGQLALGMIMSVFIIALVGVVLFQTIAQEAVKGTYQSKYNTSAGDDTITFPAEGDRIDLVGQEIFGTPHLMNSTIGFEVLGPTNYTIDEIVSETTGVKTISLLALNESFSGEVLNISYTYGADGYIDSSGGRSMALMIPLFFALGIALLVLVPTIKSKIFDSIGGIGK